MALRLANNRLETDLRTRSLRLLASSVQSDSLATKRERTMKHVAVKFHWYGPENEDTELMGQVVTRSQAGVREMVLDINDPAGEGPYLIVGKAPKDRSYFSGVNTARDRLNDVSASWAPVDVGYVGRWVGGGVEYRFSFELGDDDNEEA